MSKNIALYGGSFDPPHLGHVIAITTIINSGLVDEVWLVPTGLRFDKAHKASIEDRKIMVGILLSTMFGSKVPVYLDDAQIKKIWHQSTTYELLKEKKEKFPEYNFFFVIGSDLVKDLFKWSCFDKLIVETKFLLFQRLGSELDTQNLPSYIQALHSQDVALTSISSSLVRKMVKENKSLDGLVPPAVISHIIRNQLYVEEEPTFLVEEQVTFLKGKNFDFCSQKGSEFVKFNKVKFYFFIEDQEDSICIEKKVSAAISSSYYTLPSLLVDIPFDELVGLEEIAKKLGIDSKLMQIEKLVIDEKPMAISFSNAKYSIIKIKLKGHFSSIKIKDKNSSSYSKEEAFWALEVGNLRGVILDRVLEDIF